MKTEIRDFIDAYFKIKKEKESNEVKSLGMIFKEATSICLAVKSSSGFNTFTSTTITLDQEDLDIIYQKYYPKYSKELDDNINDIKSKYNHGNS